MVKSKQRWRRSKETIKVVCLSVFLSLSLSFLSVWVQEPIKPQPNRREFSDQQLFTTDRPNAPSDCIQRLLK